MTLAEAPRLMTDRLVLRGCRPDDAPRLQELAGQREISDTMISVPHPYPLEQVRAWLAGQADALRDGRAVHWVIEPVQPGQLIGAIELRAIEPEHGQAELSFWIGVPYWGNGYASEAARVVLRFAFAQLRINRVYAHHMVRNPASGRVLEKVGMEREAVLRQRVRKWGLFEDVMLWAILKHDWQAANRA